MMSGEIDYGEIVRAGKAYLSIVNAFNNRISNIGNMPIKKKFIYSPSVKRPNNK